MLLEDTKRLLNKLNIRARKRLGQHFLVDEKALEQSLNAADITKEDTVIEVGSGLGVLTAELAESAGRVIAVELDDNLAAMLKRRLSKKTNLEILNEDILKTDVSAVLGDEKSYKVVANLPYYITQAVIRHFLESKPQPKLMVLMVQKEVAEAIAITKGKMGILSISVAYYGKARLVADVSAQSFYPPPKVDSAILRIDVSPQPRINVADEAGFFNLVRAAFAAPRKKLVNSLAQGLKVEKEETQVLLEKAAIQGDRRAESLSLDEWSNLFAVYHREEKRLADS